jgi:hypothetical protein
VAIAAAINRKSLSISLRSLSVVARYSILSHNSSQIGISKNLNFFFAIIWRSQVEEAGFRTRKCDTRFCT